MASGPSQWSPRLVKRPGRAAATSRATEGFSQMIREGTADEVSTAFRWGVARSPPPQPRRRAARGEPGPGYDEEEPGHRRPAEGLAEHGHAEGDGDGRVDVGDDRRATGPDLRDQGEEAEEADRGAG